MGKTTLIDPKKLGRGMTKKTTEDAADFSDTPILPALKIRPINNKDTGTTDISVDILGCNFRCAHCWVSDASLSANFNHDSINKKLKKLPKTFNDGKADAKVLAEYLHTRLKKTATQYSGSGISLSGGEPLNYRGGIKALAKKFQENNEPFYVRIETTGHLIAQNEDYLDAFKDLQGTLGFYVSIKGASPETFSRFTKVDGEYYEDAFIALERLLRAGFLATPGGIVLNIFEHPDNLDKEENEITRLHDRLSAIHPKLPMALAYHKVDFSNVQNRNDLKRRWDEAGYGRTEPSKIQKTIVDYFAKKGTPIIMADNSSKVKGSEYQRTTKLLKEIIVDLQSKTVKPKAPAPK